MSIPVVLSVNTAWNALNFRVGLIRALHAQGYDVVVAAPADAYAPQLEKLGCRFANLRMDRQGTNPIRDAALLLQYIALLREVRPAAYLAYTAKPNIYGSLAAHLLGIPVVNNIAGLGSVFINESWLTPVLRALYRLALRRSARVFFQNRDDFAVFVTNRLVNERASDLVPGSGVDLQRFKYVPLRGDHSNPRFLLVGRLLGDKGVREYVSAGAQVKLQFPGAEFHLAGDADPRNPSAIPQSELEEWVQSGAIIYHGHVDDIENLVADFDCIVLPSYREGTPRSLLEAAAMGRPIITTDTPGCRDVVSDTHTGFLCRARDAGDLAEKMLCLCRMESSARAEMGIAGRRKIELEFDEQLVLEKYLAVLREIAPTRKLAPAQCPSG